MRMGQAGHGAVCKTALSRFDSGHALHTVSYPRWSRGLAATEVGHMYGA